MGYWSITPVSGRLPYPAALYSAYTYLYTGSAPTLYTAAGALVPAVSTGFGVSPSPVSLYAMCFSAYRPQMGLPDV